MGNSKNDIDRGPRPRNSSGSYYNDVDIYLGTLEVLKCIVAETCEFYPEINPREFTNAIYFYAEIIFCRIPSRTREYIFKNNYPLEEKTRLGNFCLWNSPKFDVFRDKLYYKIGYNVEFLKNSSTFSFFCCVKLPPPLGDSAKDWLDAVLDDGTVVDISTKSSRSNSRSQSITYKKKKAEKSKSKNGKRSSNKNLNKLSNNTNIVMESNQTDISSSSAFCSSFDTSNVNSCNMSINDEYNSSVVSSQFVENTTSHFYVEQPLVQGININQNTNQNNNAPLQSGAMTSDFMHNVVVFQATSQPSSIYYTPPTSYMRENLVAYNISQPNPCNNCNINMSTGYPPNNNNFNNHNNVPMISNYDNHQVNPLAYPINTLTVTNTNTTNNNYSSTLLINDELYTVIQPQMYAPSQPNNHNNSPAVSFSGLINELNINENGAHPNLVYYNCNHTQAFTNGDSRRYDPFAGTTNNNTNGYNTDSLNW